MPPTDGAHVERSGVVPAISTRWQLERDAAVRYQDVVVPWILGPFAEALVAIIGPRPGEAILDVGCGSGAAARAAALAVGPTGRVVGLDLNAGMLDVARGIDLAKSSNEAGSAAADQAGGQDAPARRSPLQLE